MVEAVVASGLVGGQTSTMIYTRDDLLGLGSNHYWPHAICCLWN